MKNFFTILFFCFFCSDIDAATITSASTGNWNAGATWVGGVVPGVADLAVIANGHTVTITANASVNSCTVNTGGYLKTGTNGGGNYALTINAAGTFTIQNGGTYENNNKQAWSSTIFNGTETFGASSTIIVNNDNAGGTFVSSSSSNFGNVTWNTADGAFYQIEEGFGFTRTFQGDLTIGTAGSLICSNGVNGNIIFSVGGNLNVLGLLRVKQASTGDLTINVSGTSTLSGFQGIYATAAGNGNGNVTMNTGSFIYHWRV